MQYSETSYTFKLFDNFKLDIQVTVCHVTENYFKVAGNYTRAFFPRYDKKGRGVPSGTVCGYIFLTMMMKEHAKRATILKKL